MGCETQMQLERIGVLNKWARPRSACTEGDHDHDGNVLADIDTIASCKDRVPNLGNKWMAAFDEHYGVENPFCVSRQIENNDPRFIEVLNIRAGARSLCRFKLRDPSPVGQILVAMCDFIGDALAEDEGFEVFAADSDELFLYERVVRMWHDWCLALTFPGVSNEPDVQGSAQSAQ